MWNRLITVVLSGLLAAVLLAPVRSVSFVAAADPVSASPVGAVVDDFRLTNCYGTEVSLEQFADKKAVAIVYLGTECPLAKLYGPRLQELQDRFGDRGLQVIGINSNVQDSLTEVADYVHRHEIKFPMLKDLRNRVADKMGARRTPEAFLLDQDHVVRYHGRIDDQYGVGISRDKVTRQDLAIAIEALLAGEPVEVASTEAVGCHIGQVSTVPPVGDITFTKHIAPIFNARCVNCHREGEIAPFTLTSYDDVIGWEDTILEVIEDERMPPWFADPAHGEFANDARLSARERELIETWVDNGMPEGKASDMSPAPKFIKGWQIQSPHQVEMMNEVAFNVPADGVVDYQHFEVDPNWTEDKYIVASEARPDKRGVVHHILVYVIPPGSHKRDIRQIVAGYAPGSPPFQLPNGVAIEVKAGSKLLFEMHYTPNGSPQEDHSYVGFRFADKKDIRKRLRGRVAANQDFQIPPRDSNYKVTAKYVAESDELLLNMSPHMHLRGKAFRYEAVFPDGNRQVLLDVPAYDFNWQLKYELKEPLLMPAGTKVLCTALFDNSKENPSNPDWNSPIGWGDQSFDEMMIGFMETVPVEDEF